MKRILFLLLCISLLSACGQWGNLEKLKSQGQRTHEGTIVEIKSFRDSRKQLLLVPNAENVDLSNKTTDQLNEIARNKGGAYYSLKTDEYEELKVGDQVKVYWNGNQNDSNPPQRGAEKIEVVSE